MSEQIYLEFCYDNWQNGRHKGRFKIGGYELDCEINDTSEPAHDIAQARAKLQLVIKKDGKEIAVDDREYLFFAHFIQGCITQGCGRRVEISLVEHLLIFFSRAGVIT